MENIIESIYKSCDENNTNCVAVSSLIEYITPYMSNNLDELDKLQEKLDANGKNSCIGFSFFQSVMNDWIATIQSDNVNNSFSEFSSLQQSFSSNNSSLINNNNTMNKPLQEQIDMLKLQLNKTTNELDLVKQQLVVCEDQNELLMADLKSQVKCNCKRENVQFNENPDENDGLNEERTFFKNKCEQLEKLLANCEKQKQKYMSQVNQLENEAVHLKEKLKFFERVKQEGRKSISEMRDSLDIKESEISTLMEVIDSLKCEVEEKVELLDFYTNEHKLLKQRITDLENLLKNTTSTSSNIFNTPKLLHQIANPISPTLISPVFKCSSPIQKTSKDDSFDLSSSSCIRIRSPHKTLKDELAEIIDNSQDDELNQIEALQKAMKQQEEIKNFLWQNMKQLYNDNEMLLDFKRDKEDELGKNLIRELANLTENLKHQKDLSRNLQEQLHQIEKTIQEKNVTMVDECTETDFWNILPLSNPTNNYTKQQMKMEKLLEKQKQIEKELNNERNINTKLTLKYQELFKENNDLKTQLHQEEEICAKLKQTEESLNKKLETQIFSIETLKEMIFNLQNENQHLNENLNAKLNKLTNQDVLINKLRFDNEILLNRNYELELKIKEAEMEQVALKKQLIDTSSSNNFLLNELDERKMEIRILKKQNEIVDVGYFVAGCNRELKYIIQQFCECFHLDQDYSNRNNSFQKYFENINLENEMILLNSHIAILVLLMKNVSEKFAQVDDEKISQDEDSFMSCSNDVSWLGDEEIIIPDEILNQHDEFFENLNFEFIDFKTLSVEEREEKFASLALLFVNVSCNGIVNVKENFHQDLIKFYSHLNFCISHCFHTKSTVNEAAIALNHLQTLKEMSENLFRLAMKYGCLLYEKKSANFWRLVLNYVAILNQENKHLTMKKNRRNLIIQTIPAFSLSDKDDGLKLAPKLCPCRIVEKKELSRMKCWLYTLLLFFVSIVVFIFYVDQLCPKNGRRTCPLQWISNLFIEKIYSPNSYV